MESDYGASYEDTVKVLQLLSNEMFGIIYGYIVEQDGFRLRTSYKHDTLPKPTQKELVFVQESFEKYIEYSAFLDEGIKTLDGLEEYILGLINREVSPVPFVNYLVYLKKISIADNNVYIL